jgi:cytochrome c biogenesis protein CcdA
MRITRILKIITLTLPLALWLQADEQPAPVQLDMFHSPGCSECEKVKAHTLPEIEALFAGEYELHLHDLTEEETIPLLLAYQERCGNLQNGKVSIVVDRKTFFSGYSVISTALVDCVDEMIAQRQLQGWSLQPPPDLSASATSERLEERVRATTLSAIIAGGITDGFNPCAISTLIFFISLLAVSKVDRRVRLLVGSSFIIASFLVYMTIGIGFILALRSLPRFESVSKALEIVIALCMVPLAYLSFRDAYRFHRSERPADVTLQIPKKIKTRIHSYMNSRLGVGGPIIGGFITGAGVTVLESVCTGQGYLPVLTLMLKNNISDISAWGLLTLYNLLFILPLTVVFICFHRGMEITALISWSKRNLVVTKILLGLFFTLMAILLLAF